MEKENTHVGDALDDWNNVKVVVSVTSLGVLLLTKEFVGHADENTKLDVKFEINENQEVVEGIVRQRGQLLAAAKKAIAECCDLTATPAGDALVAAIAAVEQAAHSVAGRGAEINVASCPNCFTVFPIDDEGDVEQHDADGWIEWKGGERPVESTQLVDVMFECGDINTCNQADLWDWQHGDATGYDIIAYRVVQEGDA